MKLRVANKVIKRCRAERAARGELNDYSSLAPYREHTVVAALQRRAKRNRVARRAARSDQTNLVAAMTSLTQERWLFLVGGRIFYKQELRK